MELSTKRESIFMNRLTVLKNWMWPSYLQQKTTPHLELTMTNSCKQKSEECKRKQENQMRFKKNSIKCQKKYKELQNIWEQEWMQTFCDFFRWYNNKDVETTLVAMRKLIDFYHSKRVDTLKLGFNLPNLVNIFSIPQQMLFCPILWNGERLWQLNSKSSNKGTLNHYYTLCKSRGKRSESPIIFPNLQWALMQVNFTVFHDKRNANRTLYKMGVQGRDLKKSTRRGTGEAASNSRRRNFFNRIIQIVKNKPSSHTRSKRGSELIKLMGFVSIAAQFLKRWVFCPCQE